MTIINLFIDFINKILGFKIMGFELISYLLAITTAIVIFKILYILSNTDNKNKKNNKGSE